MQIEAQYAPFQQQQVDLLSVLVLNSPFVQSPSKTDTTSASDTLSSNSSVASYTPMSSTPKSNSGGKTTGLGAETLLESDDEIEITTSDLELLYDESESSMDVETSSVVNVSENVSPTQSSQV